MSRYCNRDGCGHEEEQHLPSAQGGCFGRDAATRHLCLCAEFVAADAKPPSVPPLRVVTPEVLQEIGARVLAEPEPVRNRAEALERAAACHRTADVKGIARLEERSPRAERAQEHTIIEPGAKIMLAGKPREMTELHAAANVIVAETNAEDLAAGAFAMRAIIRQQANELVKLRAELENRERILDELGRKIAAAKTAPVINVQIKVDGEAGDPSKIAKAIRDGLEQFQRGPTPVA